MKRLHVVVFGRVQGVAFRAAALRTAVSRGITGWVRNISDGTVEALFEGDESDAAAMVAWCREGPRAARVTHVHVTEEPYTGEFTDFRILF